jgi:hypothetical protein
MVVVRHDLTADALLLLHFLENFLSLDRVFVSLPLLRLPLDQAFVFVGLKCRMRSIVYFFSPLLEFLQVILP